MKVSNLIILVYYIVSANKDNIKTWKESGFCYRNRYLASHHIDRNKEGLRFNISYSIDPSSVIPISGGISFTAGSSFENTPFIQGEIKVLSGGILKVLMDEINPLYPRYKPPPGDVYTETISEEEQKYNIELTKTTIEIEKNKKFEIFYQPIKILAYFEEELELVINDRQLMNFERQRRREDKIYPAIQSGDQNILNILDATGILVKNEKEWSPLKGIWKEKFKEFTDNHARGPESVAFDFTFKNSKHIFGIPLHADTLSLKDTIQRTPYRLYNMDVFRHDLNTKAALYGSVPFMITSNSKGSTGIFWNNPSEAWIDIFSTEDKQTHWIFEAGVVEFIIFLETKPIEVIEKFTLLTGPPALPPIFSLGYHQSRWNYHSEEELLEVYQGFETHNIPIDTIWLDIEYTNSKEYFTWNYEKFPTPLEMQKKLAETGRKLVLVIDPHLKNSSIYPPHQECESKGYYVKNAKDEIYIGECWPGSSSWPDYTRPEVRQWWSEQFSFEKFKDTSKIVHIWNDMNEPSDFSGPEITMPKTNLHGLFEHRELHNIFGMYIERATYEGLLKRDGKRPFVLARAFYSGSEKYGAIWTGDNEGNWGYYEAEMPMCLSIALAGISFCGADIGGYFNTPEIDLVVRWHELGVYFPFMREHSHHNTPRREPWVLGEDALRKIKENLLQRYQLIPYWYVLFYKHHKQGTPVIRPMFVEFPEDENCCTLDRQMMIGGSLLVAMVNESNQAEFYLPESRWFDYHTHEEINSGNHKIQAEADYIPAFIRGGSIIPRKDRQRRSTEEMIKDPYTIIVVLDHKLRAEGELYADDEKSFAYLQGNYTFGYFRYENSVLSYKPIGSLEYSNIIERVVVIGIRHRPEEVIVNSLGEQTTPVFRPSPGKVVVKLPKISINREWEMSFN